VRFTPRGLLDAMTPADRILSVALLAIAVALPVLARPAPDGPRRAIVTVGRATVVELPLDRDAGITVHGRLGDVRLAVEEGAIRVAASGCPQKVCLRSGARRHAGEILACVPNELVVRLVGEASADADPVDAVTE
jgi:hypothetical protein